MKNRFPFLLFILFFSTKLFSQDETDKEESWTPEFGYTQQLFKSNFKGYDLRFISPRFKISTDDDSWSEDEEKNPEKFKKARFYFEMNYAPIRTDSVFTSVREFSLNADFMYSLLHYKRFSLDAVGGIKLFFITSPSYGLTNFQKIYYFDLGLSAQMNFGFFAPFIDIKRGGFYTIGTEIILHPITIGPKKKYKAHKNLSH